MPTILVVDDDAHIREVVQYALEREGFDVELCGDGASGLERARRGGVDLVILDILMPEMDGMEVCRKLRAESPLPIIFLSSRGEEVDRIVGLELGGDDYLAKPFSPRELVARVKAVLRRQQASQAPPPAAPDDAQQVIRVGPVTLDRGRHEVSCHGELVSLTVTEFAVLLALLRRPGQVMTRQVLVEAAYSANHHITERTIDTHIRRIRAKFRSTSHDPIDTVHGVGYKAREA
jgi:two-component system OmpR family response regulator